MTGEVSVEDQTRAGGGLGVQRAAAGRWAILDIETGVSYSEASPLSDALVDHQLAEESRGASWGKFGGCGAPLSPHPTWHLWGLQLQVHVLLECPDARVHLNTQLVG